MQKQFIILTLLIFSFHLSQACQDWFDDLKICENNKIVCAKAYALSWSAEKSCLSIYKSSNTNDESDACRHFMWAFLMGQELGLKKFESSSGCSRK